ncbi:hypothetical protein ILUMI_15735 [Ignelater luminosus]|uniref:Uncharacterized protein n=1 Tax=Ignelater luminosus TaxID=2038154 RepID=A0A8K0CN16_IGNLU|nr:hypothetical protein ILUMI_15735 [Ignelater luminosus]
MKTKDYKFPALRECDAIFTANAALELADSEVCHGFRLPFVIVQRNCGQAFCSQCRQRTAALPRFDIEKENPVTKPSATIKESPEKQ